MDYALR